MNYTCMSCVAVLEQERILYELIGIVFDELYIRQDLVYDKHSSKIIGFVNLGDVDTQLSALEVDSLQSPPTIATWIMTLMVRGIFSKLHFPLANFPTAGIRATCLKRSTSFVCIFPLVENEL